MKVKPHSIALVASLLVLVVSGGLAVDFIIRSSMAYYYYNGPERAEQMERLQIYAEIGFVVFLVAAAASIILGVLVYRNRRRARTRD